jgi:hypothetical protein
MSAVQQFKPKQTSVFTKNVSSSRWAETFPRKILPTPTPTNVLPKNGPLSLRQTELYPRDVKSSSILSKSKHGEILPTNIPLSSGELEIVQENTVRVSSRISSGNVPTSVSSVSSMNNRNIGNYILIITISLKL